jgi:hypothetical protein
MTPIWPRYTIGSSLMSGNMMQAGASNAGIELSVLARQGLAHNMLQQGHIALNHSLPVVSLNGEAGSLRMRPSSRSLTS